MNKLEVKDFDFDKKEILSKLAILIKAANRKFKSRCWYVDIRLFQDTDYQVELNSGWGSYKDILCYKKSLADWTYTHELQHYGVKSVKI